MTEWGLFVHVLGAIWFTCHFRVALNAKIFSPAFCGKASSARASVASEECGSRHSDIVSRDRSALARVFEELFFGRRSIWKEWVVRKTLAGFV